MTMRSRVSRIAVGIALMAAAAALWGCASPGYKAGAGGAHSGTDAGAGTPAAPEPVYRSWIVYINDDQSYSEGPITRSIALNLTATNPSADAAGTYTGSATAKTTTSGEVDGKKLDASAIAQSSNLSFSLEPGAGAPAQSSDDALAPVSADYTGTGSITMAAGGSGTVTGKGRTASGGFSNTSSQQVRVAVNGSEVEFAVDIENHTFVFKGILRGEP